MEDEKLEFDEKKLGKKYLQESKEYGKKNRINNPEIP